jgi:hypothetical protein
MYEVCYDSAGAPSGGRKIEDRAVIEQCRAEMTKLWDKGEDLSDYFAREIAHLPAPPRQPSI